MSGERRLRRVRLRFASPRKNSEAILASVFDLAVDHLRRDITNSRRLAHIWGVVESALALAQCHGLDAMQAAWAALLHDCAKCAGREALLREIQEHGLLLEPEDLDHPALWHACVAAYWAKVRYGIEDPDVLRAIAVHPTGDMAMTQLQLALYVADYIEPTRQYYQAGELRRLAFEVPLGESALRVCRNKIEHLRSEHKPLHPRSFRALEDLEKRFGETSPGSPAVSSPAAVFVCAAVDPLRPF